MKTTDHRHGHARTRMATTRLLAACAIVVVLSYNARADTDVFTITSEVQTKGPYRFGMNVNGMGGFAPWKSQLEMNAWNTAVAMEPFEFLHQGVADGGGAEYVQHRRGSRLSYWNVMADGFWDGADVAAYRIEDGRMRLLRKGVVKKLTAGDKDSENRIHFTEAGPAVQSGDVYRLSMTRNHAMHEHMFPRMKKNASYLHRLMQPQGSAEWVIDTETHCPEGGSTGSLKLTLSGGAKRKPAGLFQYYLNYGAQSWVKFGEGKSYRCQVWLKQKGVPDGKVTIEVGPAAKAVLHVSGEWQKFELEVKNDPELFPKKVTKLSITVAEKGTVWVDNFLIYQTDVEPFQVMPWVREELKKFAPGTLRIWQGLYRGGIDSWVKDGFATPSVGGIKGLSGFNPFSLRRSLELCEYTGADPWLVLHPMFSEDDLRKFMEYLCAPADEGYGRIRAGQGRREPWSEAFGQIFLECANEAWNSIFSPRAWPGRPALYAAIADYQFRNVKQSPYYRPEKFQLVVNGWGHSTKRGGWSQRVAQATREADYLDYGYYFGGWDGLTVIGAGDDGELFQRLLLYTPHVNQRSLLLGLCMYPGLSQRYARVLRAEEDLLAEVVAALEVDGEFTGAQLATDAGLGAAKAIAQLFGRDDAYSQSLEKSIPRLTRTIEGPAGKLLMQCCALPEFASTTEELLGLELEPAAKLARVCGSLDRRGINRVLKEHPEILDALQDKLSDNRHMKKEIEAVRAGKPARYGILNAVRGYLPVQVLEKVKESPTLVEAFSGSISPEAVRAIAARVVRSLGPVLNKTLDRKVNQITAAMKKDEAFASALMAAMEEGRSYSGEAAALVAGALADACAEGLSQQPRRGRRGVRIGDLPDEPRGKLVQLMKQALQDESSAPDPAATRFALAMLGGVTGDLSALDSLRTDQALLQSLAARIHEALTDAITQTMLDDAAIANRLTYRLCRLPLGRGLRRCVYESGPGYALPGPGKKSPEEDERVGKSLALGITTLDSFMTNLSQGFGPQGYFTFKMGTYWSTHNNYRDLFPHPSWLSLQLRNLYCQGDLMRVVQTRVKTIDIPTQKVYKTANDGRKNAIKMPGRRNVPLVRCYAFKQGRCHSFLLYNRSFDEAREVKLDLPYEPAPNVTVYKLTHKDPRTTNRKAYEVKILEEAKDDFRDGYTFTLPPSSAFVLVNAAR